MFSVVKNSGVRIIGGNTEEEEKREAAMEAQARQEAERARKQRQEQVLAIHVRSMNLEIENPSLGVYCAFLRPRASPTRPRI